MKKKKMLSKKQILTLAAAAAAVLVILVLILALGPFSKTSRYEKKYEAAELSYIAGDYEKALDTLEDAAKLREREECYLLMAECHIALGDDARAEEVLKLAARKFDNKEIDALLAKLQAGDTPDEEDVGSIEIAGTEIRLDATIVSLAQKDLTELSALQPLTALESLTLTGNRIADLSPLSALTALTYLHLGDNQITDTAPLKALTSLRSLYLDNNPIEDFTPLESMTNLTTLSLRGVEMTKKQIESLRAALPHCSVYCDDDAAVEEITLGGVTFLSDVTELDLGGKNLTDISELAKCTQLTKLDLRDNSITDLSPLSGMTELTWLCLWNNKVESVSPLIPLAKLSYLDLDGNQVTNLAPLSSLTALEELWLSRNTPKSFKALGDLPKLRRLGLKETGLTDEGLEILQKITTLTELALDDNELSGEALDALKAALPNCKITHSEPYYTVTIGGKEYKSDVTEISAPSAGAASLTGLDKFTGLKRLVLTDNKLTDLTPLKTLTSLQTLDLGNNSTTGGNSFSDLTPLSGLTKLKSLSLMRCGVTDISALRNLSSLTELHLSFNSLSGISALSGLTKLTTLSLDRTGISDLSALSGLKSLSYLGLSGNKISDLTPLYGLTALTELYISDNNVTAQQVRELQAALPKCFIATNLDLSEPAETDAPAETAQP